MPSTINASTTGGGGVITTADASGVLNLQSNGVTMASISPSGFNLGSDTPSNATALSPYTGFKNRIINGAMMIDQRNAGASVTQSNSALIFPVDRTFIYGSVTSRFTAQRNAGSVTPPVGFVNYLGATVASAYSVTASDFFFFEHRIEGFNTADLNWGTANAQTVTLSFWVRSSITGTHSGALQNNDFTRTYIFTFTVTSANTWEYKTITVAGDTTGTWNTTNGTGIGIRFNLGTGSNELKTAGAWASGGGVGATGSVSVVGTAGATFYITGVQLEKGSTATSFEYRPYGTELALCQRYFQKYTQMLLSGYAAASGLYYNTYILPVELRATPTITYSNFTNSNSGNASTNAVTTKILRVQGTMTALGAGFSIFDAETSGAEL